MKRTFFVPAILLLFTPGVFTVSGVDPGASIVVEAWVVLDSSKPAKVSGNVQSALISATAQDGSKINTGNQTVPLLKAQLIPAAASTASPAATQPASATALSSSGTAHGNAPQSPVLDESFSFNHGELSNSL